MILSKTVFQSNYKDISKALNIPEEDVKKALGEILKMGLVSKNDEMYCVSKEMD